jgi:hypothetical protein
MQSFSFCSYQNLFQYLNALIFVGYYNVCCCDIDVGQLRGGAELVVTVLKQLCLF